MNAMFGSALLPTYPPPRLGFVEGDGIWLTGSDGRRYLDFAAGIAVVSLGHRHPEPLAAAHAQLDRLWHASNLYATAPASTLAQALSQRFGGARTFFCNSGTEANEAALKYARKATGKPGVLALEGSFHGRTLGSLARHGPAGEALRLRAARPCAVRPAERRRIASQRRRRRHRARPARAGAGRGRCHPARAVVRRCGRRARRGARRASRLRRGADRSRPHRHVLRLGAARCPAAAADARKGTRQRPPDRLPPRQRRRARRVRSGRPRVDVRR